MRTFASLLVLALLGGALYRLWPSDAIEALRSDPDAVLRAPWSDEPAEHSEKSWRWPAAQETPPPGALRVLFVGNSHTQRNHMPAIIAQLAAATPGLRPFFFRQETVGGAKLIDHVKRGHVQQQLARQAFDYVVLQEQQMQPSYGRAYRQREFEAPAGTLDVMIRAAGARTWLFMTYARRAGDPDNYPNDDYAQMQARVREGYRDAARALGASVVPVGLVWERVLRTEPDLGLFFSDGYHPSLLGTYLSACVFYKAFYDRSPEGNPFHAGLDPGVAARLQRAAGLGTALYQPHEL